MASRTCAVPSPPPLAPPFAVWQCLCLYVTYTLQSSMVWYPWFTLNITKQMTTIRRKTQQHVKWGFYAFIDTIMWIYNEIKRYFSWKNDVLLLMSQQNVTLLPCTLFMSLILKDFQCTCWNIWLQWTWFYSFSFPLLHVINFMFCLPCSSAGVPDSRSAGDTTTHPPPHFSRQT